MNDYDEIIVVDNGSTDNSKRIVSRFSKIRLFSIPQKTVGAIRNFGARYANGNLLAFIDADCVITKGWRYEVVNFFSNQNVDASGSKVSIPYDASWIDRAWFSQRNKNICHVNYINSGNFVIKKQVFFEVGCFDENLITGEDSELGWKINKCGYHIIENPLIEAIHLGNPKSIFNFYKQQRWHAIGMMGTYRINKFDKPLIMTAINIICIIFTITTIILTIIKQKTNIAWQVVVLLLIVPILTSVYRTYNYKNYNKFIQLIALYTIYYYARSITLINILLNLRSKMRKSNEYNNK
jgi:glycosyltransferase involved in cell wall biosynthesis